MRYLFITALFAITTISGCDTDQQTEARSVVVDSPSLEDIEDAIDRLDTDGGPIDLFDLVDAIDPSHGESCKFKSDSKSCGISCGAFAAKCVIRDDAAQCQICTPAGCSSFQTDGCDPTTWP